MKDKKISEEHLENEIIAPEQENNAGGIIGFIQKKWKIIAIFFVAIVVLIALILMYKANTEQNEYNAAKALARIEVYFLNGEYENALFAPDSLPLVRGEKVIGLIKIINEYASTKAGERATLYAADAYYQLAKYNEAKTFYEKSSNSKIPDIKIGGYAGTAACNEKEGKLQLASENYLNAVNLIQDDGLKVRYMYFAGLCNEKSGKRDEAKKIYRDIIDLNKFGEFSNMAKAGIVRLGDIIE